MTEEITFTATEVNCYVEDDVTIIGIGDDAVSPDHFIILSRFDEEDEDIDKVNLLTLHASKGLEFPFVYIMGLEEELLPHKNSIVADTIEEERRLMYVGITRAKQGLTLTLAEQRKNGGQMKQMTPSRFLDELPQDEVDWLGRKKKLAENIDPKLQAQHYLQNLKALLKR